MEQLYYTSAARLADGRSGFGILSKSPGVTEADIRATAMYHRYHRPDNLPGDGDPARCPVSMSFYRGEGSRCYLTRSVHTGEDFSGRQGNFFAHTLVIEDGELDGLSSAPILAFDAKFWVSSAEESISLARLKAFPSVTPPSAATALQFIKADETRAPLLAEILQALIERESTHRRVLLVAPVPEMCAWVYTLTNCVPGILRPRLTFSTYQRDPQDVNADIVGIDPSIDAAGQFPAMQYRVFDCASGSGKEGRVGTAAGLLSYHLLDGDAASLADIGALAERLRLTSWNELDSLAAVWLTSKSDLSEVSVELIESAGAFLAARRDDRDRVAEGLVVDAVARLTGPGTPEVKRAVVKMAVGVMASVEQRQTLTTALAKAMSVSLEIGVTDWLDIDSADESMATMLRAAATFTDLKSWAPRMIQRADVTSLHSVWWAFSAAACAQQDPGEQVWRDVAALACSEGDEDLAIALLGTVQSLCGSIPALGRKIADIVMQPIVGCWPRDVVEVAASLYSAESDAEAPSGVDRLVWALERSPARGSDLSSLLVALLERPQKLRALLTATIRSAKIRDGIGASIAQVGGIEGRQLRHVLSSTPGCDVLQDVVIARDMAALTPAQAIPLWIQSEGHRLTAEQVERVRMMLNWLECRESDATDWQPVYDLRDALAGDESTRLRCIAGYLAVSPMAPLDPSVAGKLRALLPSVNREARPRIVLFGILTHVATECGRKGADWSSAFAGMEHAVPSDVQQVDYLHFLDAVERVLQRASLGRMVTARENRAVTEIYSAMCVLRFAADCDRWFIRILAGQKGETASGAALVWAWRIANLPESEGRLVAFLGGLPSGVSRTVREDLREYAEDGRAEMPPWVRDTLLRAAGERKSFRMPFTGNRGE